MPQTSPLRRPLIAAVFKGPQEEVIVKKTGLSLRTIQRAFYQTSTSSMLAIQNFKITLFLAIKKIIATLQQTTTVAIYVVELID